MNPFGNRKLAAGAAGGSPFVEAERLLLPVRWAVIVIITAGFGFVARDRSVGLLLLVLVVVAIAYNTAVLIMVRRGMRLEKVGPISSVVHASLVVAGLLATGGLDSPFHPVLTLVLTAVAMRFPFRRALALGTSMIAAFVLGDWLTADAARFGPLTIFAALNLSALWMVCVLVRQSALDRALLLQMAAHDLRNPITVLKGFLTLMRRQTVTGKPIDDLTQMTEVMGREVDRLAGLLNEIVDAFRAREGRLALTMRLVDLVEVATSALQPFRATDERHRFVLETACPGPIWVRGDAGRLAEVIRNLLSNAAKYSPDGGDVRLSLNVQGRRARVSVRDSGVGVPGDELRRVFEAFFRASNLSDRDPGGFGLGLFICREIVRHHGGRIWVESVEGAGATFHVELPLHAGAEATTSA